MGIVTRMQRNPARITLTLVLALLFAEALTASPADAASTFTVNSTADPGTGSCDSTECSLREAITAKVAPPGVLSNDSDPEGDALTAMLLSSPSKGRLTLGANGSFTYKPKRNFHGTVSFTYGAHDGTAESNAAVVKIRVLSVRG